LKVLATVSIVSVAVIAAFVFWPSEERAVKKRLNALAETLSIPADAQHGGGDVARVTRLAQLRRYFADDVQVKSGSGDPQSISRDGVLAAIASWTPPPGGLTIEFVDVQVKIDPDAASAKVYLTAKITANDARTGEPTMDAREARLGMAKRSGEWVVASVETTDTLERPPS
jgi:ketosteroid isomerase-like protein